MEGRELETWFALACGIFDEGEGSLLMHCARVSLDNMKCLLQCGIPIS
jgi:hypothetical protein